MKCLSINVFLSHFFICYFAQCLQGLALINGTQMITSLGCEAVERANAIAKQADIVAALTLEVLKGTTKAFDTGKLCVTKQVKLPYSPKVFIMQFGLQQSGDRGQ